MNRKKQAQGVFELPSHQVSLKAAFLYWLKLGFISFGGPAGQIALMHAELVEKRRWISEKRFLHALNYCMLLPGPEATQLAIYIGWLMHKTLGGIMAGLLFIFPGLLTLILLSWIYMIYGSTEIIKAVMIGIKPAIVIIVLAAAWRIAQRTLKTKLLVLISVFSFIAITLLHLPYPVIVLSAAIIGFVFRTHCEVIKPTAEQSPSLHLPHDPAIIDDGTPTPEHARFAIRKMLATLCAGALTAIAAWLGLIVIFGSSNPLSDMAGFFTKTALVSFGGAYAVLPYMMQAAVNQYHWLNTAQMMDGLALGETTPGPLIMIVAFVGFIGSWSSAFLGSDNLFMAACLGACVACFFTFLPSFVFILVGGPLVESTRNNLRLSAPFNAISAAIVGVILSLTCLFANNVIFHDTNSADLKAITLSVLAGIAIFKYKVSTIKLLAASSVAGCCLYFFR